MKDHPAIVADTALAAAHIDGVLTDVIRLNETHWKVADALHRAYQRQSGLVVHRQQLDRWIKANSKRRQSPKLGTGHNLAIAAAAVLAVHHRKPFKRRKTNAK
mgnify:CR=1 FL=1